MDNTRNWHLFFLPREDGLMNAFIMGADGIPIARMDGVPSGEPVEAQAREYMAQLEEAEQETEKAMEDEQDQTLGPSD